jgi:hypothetical protein
MELTLSNVGLQSAFLSSFLTLLGLFIFYSIPLSCPNFSTDAYNRYNGDSMSPSLQFFCLADSQTAKDRASIAQLVFSLLRYMLGGYIAFASGHALAMFADSGLGLQLARVLSPRPEFLSTAKLLQQRMKQEKHPKLIRGLIPVIAVLIPLFVPLLSAIAPQVFPQTIMRSDTFTIRTATAASPSQLSAYNYRSWKGSTTNTKLAATAISMANFRTSDIRRPFGSGLQTVAIQYPASAPERLMAAIPLSNMLLESLDAVPLNTSDFQIQQSMLLLDQSCSFIYGVKGLWVPPASWVQWPVETFNTLMNGSVPYSAAEKDLLIQVANKTQRRPVYERSYNSKDDGELASSLYSGTKPEPSKSTMNHVSYTWRRWPYSASSPGPAVSLFTADKQPEVGHTGYFICRTNLIPISFNATIPAGNTAIRRIRSYSVDRLSPDAEYLVSLALNFSNQAVDQMQLPGVRNLGEQIQGKNSSYTEPQNDVHNCPDELRYTLMAKYPQPPIAYRTYDEKEQAYHQTEDHCMGTEFDWLFRAYLLQLSYVPGSIKPWSWGAIQPVSVVSKGYGALMLVMVLLLLGMLTLLHVLIGFGRQGSISYAQQQWLADGDQRQEGKEVVADKLVGYMAVQPLGKWPGAHPAQPQ